MKFSKLQGKVLDIEKTGEKRKDNVGNVWERCIFGIELAGFSRRTPDEVLPKNLEKKKIKLVRWCCFDWHYKLGVRKTLDPDETEAVLSRKPITTVYW